MNKLTPGSPEKLIEVTVRGVLLGLAISTIMTAANAYLGLYAGMTVSTSIPAAIISMALLRGVFKRATILENNIVQTTASAGVSVASGIIFTVPALVIAGVWKDFPYWQVTLIGLLGGVLGVLFMIPLRRTLIVEDKDLIYPEGVACAQVLKAGEAGGRSLIDIGLSVLTGVVFKALVGLVAVFKGTVEGATQLGGVLLYFGSDVSVALLGVGVIVGLEVGALVFLGGAIGWLVGIPIYYFTNPMPAGSVLDAAWAAWNDQIRYMGVGAMIVGGLSSMWSIRKGMGKSIREAVASLRASGPESRERTDQDMPAAHMLTTLVIASIATIFLYRSITGSTSVGITAGIIMIIAGFFFAAVSSYIVGLVGSSNNPISGMTICALMFASIVLLLLGMSGPTGVLAALGVAGVVCCAAATAGDTSQDLKTGYLVGATPRLQQITLLIGVIVPTFLIAPVLTLLHNAYGIGTGGEQALRAPQATLFASIAQALFGGASLPWDMVIIGAAIGVILLVTDEMLRRSGSSFGTPVMPVAVGIYLPMSLAVPIFVGGILSYVLLRKAKPLGEAAVERSTQRAVLISSGLIAGEAVAGILIAIPRTLPQFASDLPIPVFGFDTTWLTIACLAALVWVMYVACKPSSADVSKSASSGQ